MALVPPIRTRYFVVRGHRLHEEHSREAAELVHCPTLGMVADSLTKLAPASVIQVLQNLKPALPDVFSGSFSNGSSRSFESGKRGSKSSTKAPAVFKCCVLCRQK